jgi:LysR family transcriptional regulator, hypochlorite-specific transcription factor HypT
MEMAWLEDFLAILECGGFSRAAERRNVTQPALSRRVRALEQWVGTPLFDRSTHAVTLTPAGLRFRETAEDLLRRLQLGRDAALEAAKTASETLRFASTHALSLTFFPRWLRGLETSMPADIVIQLVADTMAACERTMIQGDAQFLLCHHHPTASTTLEAGQFLSVPVGADVLLPVSAPAEPGGPLPRHGLPGTPDAPVTHLAYRTESGMGRITASALAAGGSPVWLKPVFSSHLATLLVTMAIEGRGVSWSPRSLVADALAAGTLVRAGGEEWDIPMEIRLLRSRARQSPAAERFWTLVRESVTGGTTGT